MDNGVTVELKDGKLYLKHKKHKKHKIELA